MKCTDTYHVLQSIRTREKNELVEALKAHGGSYSWYDDENDEWLDDEYRGPIIAAYCPNYMTEKPDDIVIRSVWLDERGNLKIDAEESEYGNQVDIEWTDIFVGHIYYITEAIPAVDKVDDVSIGGELDVYNASELHDLQELTVSLYYKIKEHSEFDEFQVYEDVRKLLPEFTALHKRLLEDPKTRGSIAAYYELVDDFISQKVKELGYD